MPNISSPSATPGVAKDVCSKFLFLAISRNLYGAPQNFLMMQYYEQTFASPCESCLVAAAAQCRATCLHCCCCRPQSGRDLKCSFVSFIPTSATFFLSFRTSCQPTNLLLLPHTHSAIHRTTVSTTTPEQPRLIRWRLVL
jgi:hypothetical protein